MTFNTGNPIGSTDARDRLDNSENMDILENSTTLNAHPDRLGTMRRTRKGMELEHDNQIAAHEAEHDNQMQSFESDFDSRLAGMAFTRVGTFTTGATLTDMRQTLLWEVSQGGDGHEYGWTGSFLPAGKVVSAVSTPATSGGIGNGAWVDRSDVTLRADIEPSVIEALRRSYAEAGFNLVDGSFEEGGTLTSSSDMLLHRATGVAYSWAGAFPKVVAAGSTPATSGGVGAGAWLSVGDASLRSNLAQSNGATIVGATLDGSSTTVQAAISSLDSRLDSLQAKDTGSVTDINSFLTVGNFSRLVQAESVQNYINGTSIPKNSLLPYDHFGLTFKDRRGKIVTLFRRGPTHVNSRGVIMKTVINGNGQWSNPTEVSEMSDSVLDARVAAGGMMPNGSIVIAVNYMNPTTSVFDDVKFFKSSDDGETWTLIQTIDVNQTSGYSYNIPFGQAAILGDYVVIPRYKSVASNFSVGYYRSQDGGNTWSEFDVYSDATGANDFNESAIVGIGRLGFMVSRIGSGISGKFRLFRSTDGGATWSDLGDSNLTGGDSAYNVAPSLNVLRNESGTPYIVLQYVNRTDQVMYYRTSLVSSILSGVYNFSEKQRITGGLANSSGYQSGFFEGRRYLGVVYSETSAQTSAGGISVEYSIQNPADYDSGFFSVAALTTYNKSLGFSQKPTTAKLFFSPDATGANLYEVDALNNISSGTIYGIGALIQLSATAVVIRTASRVYGSTLFGESGTGTEYTSGFYRVMVWL